jgi:hypothetical protein
MSYSNQNISRIDVQSDFIVAPTQQNMKVITQSKFIIYF